MAEEQHKPPRRRRPRSTSGSEPADHPPDGHGYGDEDGDTEERGEAVGAHAAFVVAHFGGGAPATPEILDRALDVWQRLPGSVMRGAPLLRPNRPASPPADSGDETS